MLTRQKGLVAMLVLVVVEVHAFRKKASEDAVLHNDRQKHDAVGDDAVFTPAALCNTEIVKETCSLFYEDGSDFINARELVMKQYLASATDTDAFFQAINANEDTKCVELCSLAKAYAEDQHFVMPTEHDKGCIKKGGRWVCDVDLSPTHIAGEEAIALDSDEDTDHRGSDDGASSVKTVPDPAMLAQVQEEGIVARRTVSVKPSQTGTEESSLASISATVGSDIVGAAARSAAAKETVDQDPPHMAKKTLALFRIYAKRNNEDQKVIIGEDESSLIALNGTTADAAQAVVQQRQTQAGAWVTTILRLLNAGQARQFRQKWFGGSGSLSESQVKEHLLKTFNFMDRELADMYFFYPGDVASNTGCSRSGGGGTLAYVWKYVSNERGYKETSGPRCGQATEARTKQCAVDSSGNFIVYLCRFWYDSFGESDQIATVVHEAAHHTGPSDITYSKTQAQQLSQSDQMHNAANYQRFGEDVTVAGGGGSTSPRRRRGSSAPPRRRSAGGGSGGSDKYSNCPELVRDHGCDACCVEGSRKVSEVCLSSCSGGGSPPRRRAPSPPRRRAPSPPRRRAPSPPRRRSSSGGSASDSCRYANDNACDEPTYCGVGTDCTDCGSCGGASSPPRRRAAPRRRYVSDPRRRSSPPRRRSYVSPYRRRRSSSSDSSGSSSSCSSWCKPSYCPLEIPSCTGCDFCP